MDKSSNTWYGQMHPEHISKPDQPLSETVNSIIEGDVEKFYQDISKLYKEDISQLINDLEDTLSEYEDETARHNIEQGLAVARSRLSQLQKN